LADAPGPKLLLATYFGTVEHNLSLAASLPVQGLHVDLVRAPGQLDAVLGALDDECLLSLGLVDGRNIWRTDLDQAVLLARRAAERIGHDRLQVAPSCSMLHVPIDASLETGLPPEIHGWLAFAKEKIGELRVVADALNGLASASATLALARERLQQRRRSRRVHRAEVAARVEALTPDDARRKSPYAQRSALQQRRYGLPAFPTTTIGSF